MPGHGRRSILSPLSGTCFTAAPVTDEKLNRHINAFWECASRACAPQRIYRCTLHTTYAFVFLLVMAAAIVCGTGCSKPSPGESTKPQETAAPQLAKSTPPDIVFIIVDTLRADRVGMKREDVPLMPFMESFSKESWNFTRASSQASWTRPSMASAFTSLYAGVHNQQFGIRMEVVEGQDHTVDALSENLETMAEYFKAAGYATLGVQANWNMRPLFGVSQGFDRYEMIVDGQNAVDITNLCLDMIKDDASAPFFLYVHYVEPHAPYTPPEQYKKLFSTIPEITDTDRNLLATYATGYYPDKVRWDLQFRETPPEPAFSDAAKAYVEVMYDAEVRFADDEVGRLIRGVRASRPEAIIVFSADHGEELWEHGSVGHGKTVYNEVLQVPLIFSFPGEAPRTEDARVELIDILPTLAAKIGLPARDWWQGGSLLAHTADFLSPVYAETRTSIREANVYLLSVMHENMKLILDMPGNKHWLYQLESDPGELNPITDTAQSETLMLLLKQYRADNEAHPLHASPTVTNVVDQETRDILRSQGYF